MLLTEFKSLVLSHHRRIGGFNEQLIWWVIRQLILSASLLSKRSALSYIKANYRFSSILAIRWNQVCYCSILKTHRGYVHWRNAGRSGKKIIKLNNHLEEASYCFHWWNQIYGIKKRTWENKAYLHCLLPFLIYKPIAILRQDIHWKEQHTSKQ